MRKIRPEYVAAFLWEQAAASIFIAAEPHFVIAGIFFPLNGVPLAVFIVRASADRTDLAFLAGPERRAFAAVAITAAVTSAAAVALAAFAAWATLAALIVATTSHS